MNHYYPKFVALIWGVCMLFILWFGWQRSHTDWLETSFLSLLPATEQNPEVAAAIERHNQVINRKVIWLVGANNAEQAIDHAQTIEKQLVDSHLFSQLLFELPQAQYQNQYTELFNYRYQLLDQKTRNLIDTALDAFVKNTLELIYSPLGSIQALGLERDPYLIFNRYFSQQAQFNFNIERNVIVLKQGDKAWAVIIGELQDQNLKLDKLEQLAALNNHFETVINAQGGELLATGLPLYTAFGAQVAQSEISTIGLGSTIGIVLLLLLVFKDPRPLLLSCLAVGSGLLVAWVVSLQFFGKLHILTLVFGASLIGVVIDYSLHFFCDGLGLRHWTPMSGLKYVLPGIAFGLLTSLLGYAGLGFSPFPGLQEIAVFSAIGLIVSWLTVVMLFPLLLSGFKFKHDSGFVVLIGFWQQQWPALILKYQLLLSMVLVGYILIGLSQLVANDDIRALQTVPEKLFSAEQTIKQLLPIHREHSFFLVTGKQIDDWYQNEQTLVSSLRQLKQQNQLEDFQAISAFWPDQSLQRQNYQLLKQTVYQADFLKRYMTDLGFDENAYAKEVNDFKLAENLTISLTTWLNSDEKFKSQWLGCNENGCQSIVSLMGIKELDTLESLAKSDAVSWVNHTGEMSGLFKRYRFDVSILIIIVCALIYCGLLFKLGRLNATRIMAVPVVSMLSALATLGIFNQLFSLFNLFALLLVLEIGIDYAFFFYMAGQDQNVDEKRTSTSLAVTLSAFTTLLSYGLLATCTTTIVHTFGLTLLVGVLVAFLLSPLVGVVR